MQSIKLLCNDLYTKLSEFPVYEETTCKLNFEQILKERPEEMAEPFPLSQATAEAGRGIAVWTTLQESWGRGTRNGAHMPQALRVAALLRPPRRASPSPRQQPSWKEEIQVPKCLSVARATQTAFLLSFLGGLIRNVYVYGGVFSVGFVILQGTGTRMGSCY